MCLYPSSVGLVLFAAVASSAPIFGSYGWSIQSYSITFSLCSNKMFQGFVLLNDVFTPLCVQEHLNS